jgi:hypothetical protein
MRGKLRDKRAALQRDYFKRDLVERRRQPRRENRSINWQDQQLELEEEASLEEDTQALLLEPTPAK